MVIKSTLLRWLPLRQWLLCSALAFLVPTASIGGIVVNERVIVLECHVLSVEQVGEKKLRIIAKNESSADPWGIIMYLGPGVYDRWPQAKKYHRMAAILEPLDEVSRRRLDEVFTRKFGRGKSQSIFKPRGYDSGFSRPFRKLGKKASQFFLGDPGIDEGNSWNISGVLDPVGKTLVLSVGELYYGAGMQP